VTDYFSVIPATGWVKELAARQFTSPRVRGEVGIDASLRRSRVKGNATPTTVGAVPS
jgi:hypothetical protein